MTSCRLLLTSLFLLISYSVRAQTKHYVRPYFSGTHSGKSWALAFDNLETAIDSAKAGDSIFVRWGNYSPLRIAGGIPTSVRSRAFILKNEVKIYGGFAGWETTLAERDTTALFTKNVSSFIADLGEIPPPDNQYHGVLALHVNSKTVLNGFNIVSGYASGSTSDTVNGIIIKRNVGGGIYCDSASLQLAHIRLFQNFAIHGGGAIYISNHSDLNARNCEIVYNSVVGTGMTQGGGGAIFSINSAPQFDSVLIAYNQTDERQGGAGVRNENSNAVFKNSTIAFNYAKQCTGGGAVYNLKSNAEFINTTILRNSANGMGGGMYNDSSSVSLTNVTFDSSWSNSDAGAMINKGKSDAVLTNVIFQRNQTNGDGGAMLNRKSSPVLNNVIFIQNMASGSGGGVHNDSSNVRLTNVTFDSCWSNNGAGAMTNMGKSDAVLTNVFFRKNHTIGDGGAMYNRKSSPVLNKVSFLQNIASGSGGGIYNYDGSSPLLSDCTFTENTSETGNGGGFCNKRSSHPVLNNCLFTYNFAWVFGAGISNNAETTSGAQPASLTLTNVTLANNNAYYSGGGAYDDGFGNSKIRNTILQGNHSYLYEDFDAPASLLKTALSNSIIADEFFLTGTSTPAFISKRVFLDTFARDFRLATGSPALDIGDSAFFASSAIPDLSAIKTDIRGARRIMGGNVDLGAYEVCEDSTMAITLTVKSGTDISPGVSVTFTATVRATGLSSAYTWRKNGVIIAGATGATYTCIAGTDFISGDIITAAFKSATVCTDTDTANSNPIEMKVIPVGIHSYTANQSEIILFPNPNQGNFTIKGEFIAGADYQLMVNDVTGRTVYQESFVAPTANKSKEIMLENKLNAGVYFLSVKMDNQNRQVIRFVVN